MSELARSALRAPRNLALAAEAALWLALAGLAIRLLSFTQVVHRVTRPRRGARTPAGGAAARIGWAVDAATARAPWRVLCFERGLAAFLMLSLRGYSPSLVYGARNRPEDGLVAHVWVELAGEDVVGGGEAGTYAVLARYPAGERL